MAEPTDAQTYLLWIARIIRWGAAVGASAVTVTLIAGLLHVGGRRRLDGSGGQLGNALVGYIVIGAFVLAARAGAWFVQRQVQAAPD